MLESLAYLRDHILLVLAQYWVRRPISDRWLTIASVLSDFRQLLNQDIFSCLHRSGQIPRTLSRVSCNN